MTIGIYTTFVAAYGNHDAKRAALDLDLAFDLDLRRPVKPRWPNAATDMYSL
jgi:hypothetical protein